MTERDWRDRAACLYIVPDLFFPEKGQPTADARSVCAGCEVRAECLDFAMDHNITDGVWGGTSEMDRRKLRRARARQARETRKENQEVAA